MHCKHTHTHIHTHTHTRTHTCAHTHAHTHTHTHTHAHTYPHTHTCTHISTHTSTHTHMRARAPPLPHTHREKFALWQKYWAFENEIFDFENLSLSLLVFFLCWTNAFLRMPVYIISTTGEEKKSQQPVSSQRTCKCQGWPKHDNLTS